MDSLQNATTLPPLPEYQLQLLPDLVPRIPDKLLTVLLPIAAYWILSMIFHWIDMNDYFSKYRLHTPAEIVKRNHVTRYEVVRDVIIQQIIQTVVGYLLGMTEPDDFHGKEEYDIAVWARWIRIAQGFIPSMLALLGVNAAEFAKNLASSHSTASAIVSGGVYPWLNQVSIMADGSQMVVASHAAWELLIAKTMYWVAVPFVQFFVAIVFLDTWQYFWHRAMHMNKWLYTTFHSRHHRLYVPYAFGALYNHPFEGFLLDTLGAGLAFKVTRMSTRQGMLFYSGSTLKTVDDHCGYSLPFDPLQRLFPNNAAYHDIHHQSWGIKTNFSQPFFTFWDHLLGTVWTGGDVSARYERAKIAAQKKVDQDISMTNTNAASSLTSDPHPYENELRDAKLLQSVPVELQQPAAPAGKAELQAAASREQVLEDAGREVLAEEAAEEKEARSMVRKSNRRRTASSLTQSDSLRGLRERVSIHGRAGGILGMDHGGSH